MRPLQAGECHKEENDKICNLYTTDLHDDVEFIIAIFKPTFHNLLD